jgi:hypothetical protein
VPKKAQFTHERVEYNVFLFDEPLKGSKSLKTFKISLTFRFDKLWHLSKSIHIGENSQILTVSNKKNRCSPFLIVIMIDVFTCHFWKSSKMVSVSNFNKIKIVTLAQSGMSQAEISMDLRIPKSTISSILQKWRQNGTIERRQGSGTSNTSTAEEDNMLLNRLRNSPFMTAVETVNTKRFPRFL